MNEVYAFVQEIERKFPAALRLSSCGFIPRKTCAVDELIPAYIYCLILRGAGVVQHEGVETPIRAPALLVLRPGERYRYGPTGDWQELFVVVRRPCAAALAASGLIPERGLVFPLHVTATLTRCMQDLLWLARRSSASTEVDRLDRAAERVLLELMLSIAAKPRDDAASGVESIQRYVEKNLGKDHDFEALARRHGLSPTTFRRRWHAHVGCPPARHVAILRLQAASRALIETDASIARIARQLGFGSATSFCRRFRRYAGMSASSYRREHGMPTRS